MTPSGPVWLKSLLNEKVLDRWWASLDYESKWAIICNTAKALHDHKVGEAADAYIEAELKRIRGGS